MGASAPMNLWDCAACSVPSLISLAMSEAALLASCEIGSSTATCRQEARLRKNASRTALLSLSACATGVSATKTGDAADGCVLKSMRIYTGNFLYTFANPADRCRTWWPAVRTETIGRGRADSWTHWT